LRVYNILNVWHTPFFLRVPYAVVIHLFMQWFSRRALIITCAGPKSGKQGM
jgi:hypothetical protein